MVNNVGPHCTACYLDKVSIRYCGSINDQLAIKESVKFVDRHSITRYIFIELENYLFKFGCICTNT